MLAGIMLLPLGYTTWVAAAAREREDAWARRVLVANTVVVFTMSITVLKSGQRVLPPLDHSLRDLLA